MKQPTHDNIRSIYIYIYISAGKMEGEDGSNFWYLGKLA